MGIPVSSLGPPKLAVANSDSPFDGHHLLTRTLQLWFLRDTTFKMTCVQVRNTEALICPVGSPPHSPNTCRYQPKHKLEDIPSPRNALLGLPEELIGCIAMELDLQSILSTRKTCRLFDKILRGQQVWRALFRRSIGISIPTPFFLSNPLEECSAMDLERDLRRWENGWVSGRSLECSMRRVNRSAFGGLRAKTHTLTLLPGGRWLLSGCDDGSVWYFDLSDDSNPAAKLTPKKLLPSPFAGTPHAGSNISIEFSVDFTSKAALGQSGESHYLTQFHIVVVTWPEISQFAHTQVDVWRIHVSRDAGNEGLIPGTQLSSFCETLTPLRSCSLYGSSVAYALRTVPTPCSVIVDWADANGKIKGQDFVRRYIPSLNPLALRLLPGDRLLAVSYTNMEKVALYNWRADCAPTTHPPGEQPLIPVAPFWTQGFHRVLFDAIPPPMTINNSTRLTLPTSSKVLGLVISEDCAASQSVQIVCLLNEKLAWMRDAQAFGYHRGVVSTYDFASHTLERSQYLWPDEVEAQPILSPALFTRHLKVDNENWTSERFRLVYDQFTNRTTLSARRCSRFIFLGPTGR
ncbi:hypothetical protein NMY22_g13751 [Coprinellus aureogranulatus]|nr:hypothetical protein NMY22_g13751 [Coprinellus aureogranulatus]